nr:reverse transcriptase domain, reverse transcriptase zinc-binding domain protein [Tanacetum cinerariifolium]
MANIENHKLLLFKVDFEKAFDSVCWGFLHDIMLQMGFGAKWLMWMNACLNSASIFVLINEAPLKEFKMERACNKGIYQGISLMQDGDNLSLLQHADDALLFGKWSRSNANTLILILKCFEEASGLKVNLAKSKIFGIGVEIEEVETGFKESVRGISWVKWNSILLDRKLGGHYGTWHGIINAVVNIEKLDGSLNSSFKLKISNGSDTLFWKDKWCEDGSRLMDRFPRLFALDSLADYTIRDQWGVVNGSWCGLWSWRSP